MFVTVNERAYVIQRDENVTKMIANMTIFYWLSKSESKGRICHVKFDFFTCWTHFFPYLFFFPHSWNVFPLPCLFFFPHSQNTLSLRKDFHNLRLQYPKCEPPILWLWWSSSKNRCRPSSERERKRERERERVLRVFPQGERVMRVQKEEKARKKISPSKKSKLYMTNLSLWLTFGESIKDDHVANHFCNIFVPLCQRLFH